MLTRCLVLALALLLVPIAAKAATCMTYGGGTIWNPCVISQVDNAPGWLPNHSYTFSNGPPTAQFTRVNNGPGWNGSLFIPYSILNSYQLTSAGTCTSAPSGGPSGVGSAIVDGTCTWKYLHATDYVTLTGWSYDAQQWTAKTYNNRDTVVSGTPLAPYQLADNVSSCSSTIAPTGTGGTLADGCTWHDLTDLFNGSQIFITYTSGNSFIPTETFAAGNLNSATVKMTEPYEAQLWNSREYLGGLNGETKQIATFSHNYRYNDSLANLFLPPGAPVDGLGIGYGYPIIITTASGESFRDTLLANPSVALGDYNVNNGVGVHGTGGTVPFGVDGIEFLDNAVDVQNIQALSDTGGALGGVEERACNYCYAENALLEGGVGSTSVILWGAAGSYPNDLIINRGLNGVRQDYPGYFVHDTIVNEGSVANSTCIVTNWYFEFPLGLGVGDTACAGFDHFFATLGGGGTSGVQYWVLAPASCNGAGQTATNCLPLQGQDNFTDSSSSDNGTVLSNCWVTGGCTVYSPYPSTTYNVSPSTMFTSYPGNYRIPSSSPLYHGGAAWGAFNPTSPPSTAYASSGADTPDILGTIRPQSGRYDAGAFELNGSAPVLPAVSGRRFSH